MDEKFEKYILTCHHCEYAPDKRAYNKETYANRCRFSIYIARADTWRSHKWWMVLDHINKLSNFCTRSQKTDSRNNRQTNENGR